MKALILFTLTAVFFSSMSHAAPSCYKEIVEAAQNLDGRQSPNCVVTVHSKSVAPGGSGKVEVKCPAFIPGNPQAAAPYLIQDYTFKVSPQSCEVSVVNLEMDPTDSASYEDNIEGDGSAAFCGPTQHPCASRTGCCPN